MVPPSPLPACLLLISTLFNHCLASIRHVHPIELTIQSGSIRGEYLRQKGNDYAIFKGIPYAAPPVGSLRFQMPEPPAKWRGVMNATQYSALCVQKREGLPSHPERSQAHFSEDCLYLNVFAPTQFTNDTYPVVVFIHGGRFQYGAASDLSQQAILDNFVARKIVFVSMNYRLGPLGFLSTGDASLPGNIGLWDILLALQWTKANAQVFGGDSDNILVMGNGAGAAAASILALSPKAEGLFHRVLLMSGSALSPGAVRDTAINATWNLDTKLHCRSFNSSQLIDCFRKKIKDEILNFDRPEGDEYEEFVPIVDGPGGIIPDPIERALMRKLKHSLMIGTTKDESSLYVYEKNINVSAITAEVAADTYATMLTNYTEKIGNKQLVKQACIHEYINTKVDPAFSETILQHSVLKMFSHFWYDAPSSRLAEFYLNKSLPVYLYSFDHVSENFYDIDRAFHGVDAMHLFNIQPKFLHKRKDMNWKLDERVTEIFSELISNFARHGSPTPMNSGYAFNWTSVEYNELNYLSITDSPQLEVGYRWQGHVFWNRYVTQLEDVDVGNLNKVAGLEKSLGDFQLATWMLLFSTLFFFAILVGLACYCTRKESEEDDI
ncbi:hypothetical protein PFISCL1PPCAC_23697 [Pristionchus fissidentatus]|uniref:Carboxylesterase type B domain-containing protein n=1 Tax=Pristionchus fissidentatus TaxID=1538716 RepID=A0AAV5WPE5_9BILA|nr:hypothetical protein PFISCL1PPCAC_23697 [Pristionchus fissidentatus]